MTKKQKKVRHLKRIPGSHLWKDRDGLRHLSECLLVEHPELRCTCRSDAPEWTIT